MDFTETDEVDENAEAHTLRCHRCRSRIDHGNDIVSVTEGVLGPRGIVRLDEQIYCCTECVRDEFEDKPPVTVLRRRVP